MPFYLTILIFLVVISLIIYLITYRIKLDEKLNTKLNNEIRQYSKTDLILTKICKVKDYDSETIISFPTNRRVWFFKQGILIYDINITGFGFKSNSTWIYFEKRNKNMFTGTVSRGEKSVLKNEKNHLIVEAYIFSNKLPIAFSMEDRKFEIEIEIPEYKD